MHPWIAARGGILPAADCHAVLQPDRCSRQADIGAEAVLAVCLDADSIQASIEQGDHVGDLGVSDRIWIEEGFANVLDHRGFHGRRRWHLAGEHLLLLFCRDATAQADACGYREDIVSHCFPPKSLRRKLTRA